MAAGRGVGAGEAQKCSSPPATFDGAGPLSAYCHPWDPGTMVTAAPGAPGLAWMSQGFCTSFLYSACTVTFSKEASIKEFLLKNQARASSFFRRKENSINWLMPRYF